MHDDFKVGPGPKFHVYLVPDADVTPRTEVEKTMFVDLGRLRAILGARGLPPAAEGMLAEAVTLAALLASGFKYKGVFTMQTQGDEPIGLMVADLTSEGALRGYARVDAARVAEVERGDSAPVPRLLGAGNLSFTLDQGAGTERYQGIVALEGARLGECVQAYFRLPSHPLSGFRPVVS